MSTENIFLQAIEQSIESSRQAEENKNEIYEVIELLASAIMQKTGGIATIDIAERSRRIPAHHKNASTIGAAIALGGLLGFKNEEYSAICIVKASDASVIHEIAEWEIHEKGYPCILNSGKTSATCHDKESLMYALAEALQQTSVGKALASIAA